MDKFIEWLNSDMERSKRLESWKANVLANMRSRTAFSGIKNSLLSTIETEEHKLTTKDRQAQCT